jgi:AbiV family abortive infection protein
VAEEPIDPALLKLVGKLSRAANDNALRLVEEADLLDRNGHKARAFALTVLAAEEMGKAFICMLTEAHAKEPNDFQAFYEMVRGRKRHETKLLGALYVIQQVREIARQEAGTVGQLAQELADLTAGDLDAAKMRALYVDIEAGEIATPALVASHEGAQERARALRREIVGWSVIMAANRADRPSG